MRTSIFNTFAPSIDTTQRLHRRWLICRAHEVPLDAHVLFLLALLGLLHRHTLVLGRRLPGEMGCHRLRGRIRRAHCRWSFFLACASMPKVYIVCDTNLSHRLAQA